MATSKEKDRTLRVPIRDLALWNLAGRCEGRGKLHEADQQALMFLMQPELVQALAKGIVDSVARRFRAA